MKLRLLIFGILLTAILTGFIVVFFSDSKAEKERNYDESIVRNRLPVQSARIRELLNRIADQGLSWQERVDAVRRLPVKLEEDEIEALFAFLRISTGEDQREDHFLVLNEVMEQLRLGGQAGQTYGEKMAELILDPGVDPVIRDYAIQHAALWLDPGGYAGDTVEANPVTDESREVILDSIVKVVLTPANSPETLVGTGLTAIADLRDGTPIPKIQGTIDRVRSGILSYIDGSVHTSEANRIAAIDVAARMRLTETHASIRHLAAERDIAPALRLSAIAALGTFGKATDKAFLTTLAKANDRLSPAARTALSRLSARHGATSISDGGSF